MVSKHDSLRVHLKAFYEDEGEIHKYYLTFIHLGDFGTKPTRFYSGSYFSSVHSVLPRSLVSESLISDRVTYLRDRKSFSTSRVQMIRNVHNSTKSDRGSFASQLISRNHLINNLHILKSLSLIITILMAKKEQYAPNLRGRSGNRDVNVIQAPERNFVYSGIPEGLSNKKKRIEVVDFMPNFTAPGYTNYNRYVKSLVSDITEGSGNDQRYGRVIYVTGIKFQFCFWLNNGAHGQLTIAQNKGRPIDEFLNNGAIGYLDEERFNVLYSAIVSQEAGYIRPTLQDEILFDPPLIVRYSATGTPMLNNQIYIGLTSSANLTTNQLLVRGSVYVQYLN